MTTEATTTTAPKTVSYLEKLHAEFLARGGKPDPKAVKAAAQAWETAKAAKEKASQALEKAMAAESAATADLVRLRGKGQFKVDGITYIAMTGKDGVERVWFRPQSKVAVGDLY